MITKQEEKFAQEYNRLRNAKQAYINAFDVTAEEAQIKCWHLLEKQGIKDYLKRYEKVEEARVSEKDYIDFLIRGAFADLGNYISFKNEELPQYNEDGTMRVDVDTGEPIVKKVNRIYIKDSDKVDTSLISAIRSGKDGVLVQLVDKMTCWNKLCEYYGWKSENNVRENLNDGILEALTGQIKASFEKDEGIYDDLRETLRKEESELDG